MKPKIIFTFKSEYEKQYFLGQLSDGWGENYVRMKWKGSFEKTKSFDVRPICVRCEEKFVDDCGCEVDFDEWVKQRSDDLF